MSRFAAHRRNATEGRPAGRRPAGLRVRILALPLALPLALGLAQQAAAQSNSGIYINNDVLNNLGPGPSAAPPAPLAPAAPATPLSPRTPQAFQAPAYQAPATPGGLSFQTQGSGNYVVTRPGTLLFPPLQAPTSTLAPAFQHDNHAARTEALNKAFAGGPEPTSQLLIPLDGPTGGPSSAPSGGQDDAVVIYENNLPPADPQEQPQGERIVLRMPPTPALPKPAVPAGALAEVKQAEEQKAAAATSGLAPEFQAPSPAEPAAAPAPAIADVEEKALAQETSSETSSETAAEPAAKPVAAASVDETPMPTPAKPAAPAPQVAETPAPAAQPSAPAASMPAGDAPTSSADMPAPVAMTEQPAAPAATSASAPVSLLPADNPGQPEAAPAMPAEPASPAPGVQTASLSVGDGIEDMSFLFDVDSAELSPETQAELRSLADALRSNEAWIQVLGFAEGAGGSEDQARKLALSRALKVRSFLIEAGIASKRIQVRSMGGRIGTGPANRVDIKPVGS